MATKADFTEEEWATLVRSPIVAGSAITLADPGGPIEVVKETSAVVKFVTGSESEGRDDLVGEIAREVRSLAEQRTNPIGDFKPRGALAGKQVLEEISRAGEIVRAKGTPEEAEAFREWIMECAQRAADAAKEGGFMGFHARQGAHPARPSVRSLTRAQSAARRRRSLPAKAPMSIRKARTTKNHSKPTTPFDPHSHINA